jgi:deoxycitidine kinase/deoxyguanosine kinase
LISDFSLEAHRFVYLQTNPEISLERIKKRSRDGESNIPLDYLKALHERHESWLSSEDNVLYLDVSSSIFEDEVMEEFLRQIKAKFNLA